MPYSANQPSLVYNYALSVLEIIGDYFVSVSFDHYFMNMAGSFTKYPQTLYTADAYSTLVFSENVGTICIGGLYGRQNVYIVTQNPSWPTVSYSQKFLTNIQGNEYKYFGVTSNENSVYLVAGGSSSTQIQSINFDDVRNLNDAKSKTWETIGQLSESVTSPGVEYLNAQLIVFYAKDSPGYIQTFILESGQSKKSVTSVIDSGLNQGLKFPGSYVNNDKLSLFGGYSVSENCVQQVTDISSLASVKWNCVSNSNTTLEGLVYPYSTGTYISFANFMV